MNHVFAVQTFNRSYRGCGQVRLQDVLNVTPKNLDAFQNLNRCFLFWVLCTKLRNEFTPQLQMRLLRRWPFVNRKTRYWTFNNFRCSMPILFRYLGSLFFATFDVEIHQSILYYYSYALNTDLRVVSQITSIPTAAQFPLSLSDGVFASPI